MLTAFLMALPIAFGTVLATLPVVTVPLILAGRPGRSAGLAFLAGWLVISLIVGGVAILLSDLSLPGEGPPAPWVVWLRLVLGVGLIGMAVRKWVQSRTTGGEAEQPAWMRRLETLGPFTLFAVAMGLVLINPKNFLLIASGALIIAAETPVPAEQAVALLGFVAIASLGVASPQLLALALGPRAEGVMTAMNGFMARNSGAILSLVLAVLGVVMIVEALADL